MSLALQFQAFKETSRARTHPTHIRQSGSTLAAVAVARELGIDALTAFAPLVPGAPLCRAHGAEVVLADGAERRAHGGGVHRRRISRAAEAGVKITVIRTDPESHGCSHLMGTAGPGTAFQYFFCPSPLSSSYCQPGTE